MDKLTAKELDRLVGRVPEDRKALIDAKVEECITILENKLDRVVKLKSPVVLYDLKGTTGGKANAYHIRLNIDLVHDDEQWDEFLNRIVPHEVAHVVQRQIWPKSSPHGGEWQYVMMLLGLPADRTHSLKVKRQRKTKKYIYTCDRCGDVLRMGASRHSKQQVYPRYAHGGDCGGKLTFTGKMVIAE